MNPNQNDFSGKVALVTGAASGIGRATALAFAERGANVVIADVNEQGAAETCSMIEGKKRRTLFVKCDVSRESDIQNMLRKSVETFGKIDYAFNNAGTEGKQAPTADCTNENWEQVIGINLKGVWLCMKYEIQQMLAQKTAGAIVNCSSIAGMVGFPGIPAYTASKHGVIGLTKAAALEYAKSKIRINAVCPGVIQTPMIDRYTQGSSETKKLLAAGEPIGRVGQPQEIAAAVTWLCSDEASFVTGHPMVIDGGWVAQ